MKITIITDNTIYKPGLEKEWGFACLVEEGGAETILFDTGASGLVLLHNMKKLNIEPQSIQTVVISHDHWDHTGGLADFTESNGECNVYVPQAFMRSKKIMAKKLIAVGKPVQIDDNVYSTGQLKGIEQSLAVKTSKGVVVIAGCSHPGVKQILNAAGKYGRISALVGGLHGFRDFDVLKDLDLICATHCTQYKEQIMQLYPDRCITGGSGREITI